MRSISRADTSSRSRSAGGSSRSRNASCTWPDTDDSGVPISCASCAASWPSVASRTFDGVVEAHVVEQAVELRQRRVLLGQVVRRRLDLGGEPLIERADLRVGLRQPLEHAVEALRQPPHLVGGVDRDAARQVAALDVAHRARQRLQRPADDPLRDQARHQRQHDDERRWRR